MEYYGNEVLLFVPQITNSTCWSSIFTSFMTMISYFINTCFTADVTSVISFMI